MKSRRANTLIELTVAFVIIAILASIAVVLYTGTINNEAANTAELSLSNLTTVAETLALHQGLAVPTASDYSTALAEANPTSPTYVPELSATATNPTSVVVGSTTATSPGQVAVDAGTTETGVAMATVNGGCVYELVTEAKVLSFVPSGPPLPCSADTALSAPTTTTTTLAPVNLSTPNPVVTNNQSSGSTGTMSWDWTAVTGSPSLITYIYSLSPTVSGCSSGTTTSLAVNCASGMTPGTKYTFSVTAGDQQGNESATGSAVTIQVSATTTNPTTTTTTQPPAGLASDPLYMLATSSTCSGASPVIEMSGSAIIESDGGLGPIGVDSSCASSVTLSGSAYLKASSIHTADSSLNSYCFESGTRCSTTKTGPSETYKAPPTDPFKAMTKPANPSGVGATSCSPVNNAATTCAAGEYASGPSVPNNATVNFSSGVTVFDKPMSIAHSSIVKFEGGTYWFKGGLSVSGDSTVTFDNGTYIFGNSSSDTCSGSVCLSVADSSTVSTGSDGALLYIEAGASNITGAGSEALLGDSSYDWVAIWDAAAVGTTNPLTISGSGTLSDTFGGLYVPNGQIVMTGAGSETAEFVEAASAVLSGSGSLLIGSA